MPKNEPLFQRKFLKNDKCKCKCHNKTINTEKWGVYCILYKNSFRLVRI